MRVPYSPPSSVPSLGQKLLRVDLPQDWRHVDQHTCGYCYLTLYEEEHHQKVAFLLKKYPDWLNVRTLGGFKDTGTFSMIRARNNVIHISTDGIGVPSTELRMDDSEILGAQLEFTPGYIKDTWPLAILIWYVRMRYLNCSWETTLPTLFVTAVLVSPPWVMMVCCGQVIVPTPEFVMKVISKRFKASRSQPCFTGWFRYMPLLLITLFAIATDARMSIDTHSFIDRIVNAKPDEMEVIRLFHPKYMAVFDSTGDPMDICITDYDVRGDALDLDVDDHVLEQYLGMVCPSLKDEVNWLAKAKDTYLSDKRCNLVKYAKRQTHYVDQISNVIADESVIVVDSAGELLQDTIAGGKRLLETVNERKQELGGALIDETDTALATVNTAVTGVVRGVNHAMERRAGHIEPLIKDLDTASDLIASMLPMPSKVVMALKDQVDNLNKNIEVKFNLVSIVNKAWNVGSQVASDVHEVGGQLYEQGVKRAKLQLSNTKVDEDTKPITMEDIRTFGSSTFNGIVTAGEEVGHYVRDVYAENNVKDNAAALVESGPWLTEKIGETIGKLPNGFAKGTGASVLVTDFVKDMREATIGPVDTPEQRDRKRELKAQVQMQRAKSRGHVVDMFSWLKRKDKPLPEARDKHKGK